MKRVYIDSKELKAKINYLAILVSFGIAVISYFSVGFFGLSGIIKWVLYLISAFFVLIVIGRLTSHEISYCMSCDEAFDFDVTKCPLCGSELKHIGKRTVECVREEIQERKEK